MLPPSTMKPSHVSKAATSQYYTSRTNPVSTVQQLQSSKQQNITKSSMATQNTILTTKTPSSTTPIPSILISKTGTKHQTTIKPTTTNVLQGRTKLCPSNVRHGAHISGFLLAQYQQSCFEVCNQAVAWYHADAICRSRGGQLASLNNRGENDYLHGFLISHFHDKSFWIGLNDLQQENYFKWSSGEHSTYRNWELDRNTQHHLQEDCVVMMPDGRWDDKNCGSKISFTEYLHTHYPYVCEYDIAIGAGLVG